MDDVAEETKQREDAPDDGPRVVGAVVGHLATAWSEEYLTLGDGCPGRLEARNQRLLQLGVAKGRLRAPPVRRRASTTTRTQRLSEFIGRLFGDVQREGARRQQRLAWTTRRWWLRRRQGRRRRWRGRRGPWWWQWGRQWRRRGRRRRGRQRRREGRRGWVVKWRRRRCGRGLRERQG